MASSAERGGKKSSGVKVDENGPRLLGGFDAIPLEDLEMKRHLKGKSNKDNKECDLKKRSFSPYLFDEDVPVEFEMCARLCPKSEDEDIVPGTVPSKSAEKCCKKYPEFSPEGFCFSIDQLCVEDKTVCEKEVFYHYITPLGPRCARGCGVLPVFNYEYGLLPTTTEGYKSAKACCDDNGGCGVDDINVFDLCPLLFSESTATTQSISLSTSSGSKLLSLFGSKLSFKAELEGMSLIFSYSMSY